MACDDRVIDHGADAVIYAESLVKAAERNLKGCDPSFISHQPAFFTSRQTLERRIEMILNTDRVRVLRRGWRYLILPTLLMFALAGFLVPERPATAQQLQKKIDGAAASLKDEGLKGLLGKYMADNAAYEKLVNAALSDSDAQMRDDALRQLVDSKQQWATAALEQIYDATGDKELRSTLIGFLYQRRDSQKLLKLAIQEQNPELRQQAVEGLLKMEGSDQDGALIDLYTGRLEREVRESIIRRLGQQGDIRGLAIVGDIEAHGTNDPALLQFNWEQLEWMANNHENAETRRQAQEWLAMRRRQLTSTRKQEGGDLPPPPPPPPKPSPLSLNDSATVAKLLQQQPSDENIVLALIRETFDAIFKHDTAFLDHALSDDFQMISDEGILVARPELITFAKHYKDKITKFGIDELRLKGEGNSIVATFAGTFYAEVDGREVVSQFRYTINCLKQQGAWQIVGLHQSQMK